MFLLSSSRLISYAAIMRFAQCGAVEKDCNSVLLDAIQEKTYTANTAQPEAAELRLDE